MGGGEGAGLRAGLCAGEGRGDGAGFGGAEGGGEGVGEDGGESGWDGDGDGDGKEGQVSGAHGECKGGTFAAHHCRSAAAVGQRSQVVVLLGHLRQCWGVGGGALVLGHRWGVSVISGSTTAG